MWYILAGSLQVPHQVASEVLVLVGDQCVGHALGSRSTRPADTMCVGVDVTGHIKIYNCSDMGYVQASGWQVQRGKTTGKSRGKGIINECQGSI